MRTNHPLPPQPLPAPRPRRTPKARTHARRPLSRSTARLSAAASPAPSPREPFVDPYENSPVALLTIDPRGRITDANRAAAALLGKDPPRTSHRTLRRAVTAESRPILQEFLTRVFATPGPQAAEVELRHADGSTRWVSLHGTLPAPDATRKVCHLAVLERTSGRVDPTSQHRVQELAAANAEAHRELRRRKQVEASLRRSEQTQRELLAESRVLHAQMRNLTHRILVAQEEERKAISRELHDEVAQMLAGINVHLAVLNQTGDLDRRSLRRRVARTQRLVGHSVEVVHRFARQLRPTLLDDLGLIPALRSHIQELPGRKGLRIRFSAFSEVELLDNARRTVLYRVAQEALTNVTRHARASVVTIRIQRAGDTVRLTVHDNGRSFRPDRLLASPGRRRLGLLGMRERVEMVGGRLEIESAPGQGTTVRATLPFPGPVTQTSS